MKYQWSLERIQKHKKYYKSLLKYLKNEECLKLKECISYFEDMENIIKTGCQCPISIPHPQYKDKEKVLPLNTYDDFKMVHPKVRRTMIEAMQSLAHIEDTYDSIELPTIKLTDEELVEMALEFARWVPDKTYKKQIEKYIRSQNHLLQFATPLDEEEMGLTYPFYYPKYRPYFLINRLNTIEDFATLNHELAHGVFYVTDTFTNEYNHYYLTELEGNFFDFLSYEYLKEQEESSVLSELEYGRMVGRINNLIDFYLIDSSITLYDKKGRVTIEPIHKRIMQDELTMYLDESILFDSLQENPQEDARYGFSYLTSLDLEKTYDNDREYAFYLLKRIRRNKTENIFGNLEENGITFMKDGYENLKIKVKNFDRDYHFNSSKN